MHDLQMLDQRIEEDDEQKAEQADRQARNLPVSEIANLTLAFLDKPARAQQRVAEAEPDAAENGEGAEPGEIAAAVLAMGNRDALPQCAARHPLNEGGARGAAGEAQTPDPAQPFRLGSELEGDAAKDQPRQ